MPNRVQGRTARQYNLHLVSSFKNVEGRRAGVDIDLDQVRRYQIEISLISGGEKQQDPDHFPNRRTSLGGEPWSAFIRGLLASGVLSPDSDVLDVGPRYLSEIRYFRDDLGLPRTIGLDLYTKDESLIKVGDMHAMPFADNSFDMLFTRATHDKAYDIRKALAEHVRVVRPGGVIISEDGMSYIVGVSELARTDLKSTAVLLRMYGPTAGEILYQKDLASTNLFCRRYGFLAIRVRKS
jgi:SAM-dependent methyltransferase